MGAASFTRKSRACAPTQEPAGYPTLGPRQLCVLPVGGRCAGIICGIYAVVLRLLAEIGAKVFSAKDFKISDDRTVLLEVPSTSTIEVIIDCNTDFLSVFSGIIRSLTYTFSAIGCCVIFHWVVFRVDSCAWSVCLGFSMRTETRTDNLTNSNGSYSSLGRLWSVV